MLLKSITNNKYKIFAETLYNNAFPIDERRDFALAYQLIGKKGFDFFVLIEEKNEEKPIGILGIWEFDKFIYIEHFAIHNSVRGRGYGRECICKLQQDNSLPIILEVEPPIDKDSKRRIEFYKRLNFSLLDHSYIQPPYSQTQNPIPMNLMISDKNLLLVESIEDIINEIHNKVYGILNY